MAIDREKILAAAQKYVEKKKYDKAVIEYQKVIQEDPNDARTLLKIGDLQSKMEEYANAVATYERVGKFYATQGFSLKAIAVYKQIREIILNRLPQLEEKYSYITPKLAELYQQLGLTSDALAALDEVATRLQRQGREQEAVEVFRKIVDLDPSNPLPHLRLAEALMRGKDTDGAVAEFAIAAGQLTKLGRRDDALKVIERLLQHRPDPVHARAAAELYLARNLANDGLQALAKLQICFQADPHNLDTLGLLARAFNHIGQAAKAIEVQKEMARIARDTGRSDLFQEIIDRLLKLVPNDEIVRQLAVGSVAPAAPPEGTESGDAARSSQTDEGSDSSYEDVGDVAQSADPIELSRRAKPPSEDGDGVEANLEIIEEESEPPPESAERVGQILADAASLRRARLPTKAIATLRAGLKLVPRSLEMREVLCDVLLESGHAREAVDEMIELAGLQIERLDAEDAVRTLQDALAIDPHDARATEMLRALGYELVEEPTETAKGPAPHIGAAPRGQASRDRHAGLPPLRPAYPSSVESEASLPSYDLEEIGPDEVVQRARSEPSVRAAPVVHRDRPAAARGDAASPRRTQSLGDELDDPFAEAPLPSFPLEGPPDAPAAPHRPPRGGPELESALEEAEFFASRGLYGDARVILDEQLARLPRHPLLLERIAELDAHERSVQGGSGTRPAPGAGGVEDRAFDIAESLGALDRSDRASGVGSGRSLGGVAPTEQVDVEEVFAKFKEGVAKQIGADDAQSHYDLGVAYKDMELLDDAIREFETAARDPKHACVCHSMIGMIHLERGHINEAIDALLRALQAPDRTKEQDAALSYELGAAYEAKKMNKQALEYFQRTARHNPSFRDVADRLRRLQKVEIKQPTRAVAVGADDEFDRAFDDILGKTRT